MNGRSAKTSSTLTIGFCCGNCKGKFDADPAAFADKVRAAREKK